MLQMSLANVEDMAHGWEPRVATVTRRAYEEFARNLKEIIGEYVQRFYATLEKATLWGYHRDDTNVINDLIDTFVILEHKVASDIRWDLYHVYQLDLTLALYCYCETLVVYFDPRLEHLLVQQNAQAQEKDDPGEDPEEEDEPKEEMP